MVFLVIFHHQLVKKGLETFRPQLTVGYDIIVPQDKQPEVLVPPAGLSCLGTSCWAACCLLSRNLRPGSQLSHYLRRKVSSHLTIFQSTQNQPQSLLLNNNQLQIQESLHIKNPTPQQERYQTQEEEVIFYLGSYTDTFSLPGRAHQFQVNSAAVASADTIAINKTPLVIRPTQVTQNPKI